MLFRSKLKDIYSSIYLGYRNKQEEKETSKITSNIVFLRENLALSKTDLKYLPYLYRIRDGKTISEEKEVIVNQYMSAQGVVQYNAGDWTKEEIEELQGQSLYNINKEKVANNTTGLNFTFGGFTYDGDTANASDIANGNIITSRNQSVTPQSGWGTPKYSGWQILESKKKRVKENV